MKEMGKLLLILALQFIAVGAVAQSGWFRLPIVAQSMYFWNADTGIVQGTFDASTGTFRTSDGGKTWSQILRLAKSYLVVGNLVATDSAILRTADAGMTWSSTTIDPTASLTKVYCAAFPSADTEYLGGTDSHSFAVLLRSVDSGKTWKFNYRLSLNSFYRAMAFKDGIHGMTSYRDESNESMNEGYVMYTSDGGTNWSRVGNEAIDLLYLPTNVWLATSLPILRNYILASSNSGQSWDTLVFNPSSRHSPGATWVGFLGKYLGYAVGLIPTLGEDTGSIYKTTDGGVSWILQDTSMGVSGVQVISPDIAYALGDKALLKTVNGGGVGLNVVGNLLASVSNSIALSHNFPNPVASQTALLFSTTHHQIVDVKILNVLGKECAQIFSGNLNAGDHSFEWNASHVPNGVYFCVVRSESGVAEMPLVVRH